MGPVSSNFSPPATQVQNFQGQSQVNNVQGQQQEAQKEALDVVKDVLTGKVSPKDGLKKLQELVNEQAAAQATLAPGASVSASTSASGGGAGYSMQDGFDAPAAKPKVNLGTDTAAPADLSYLEAGGGGSKRGIAASQG